MVGLLRLYYVWRSRISDIQSIQALLLESKKLLNKPTRDKGKEDFYIWKIHSQPIIKPGDNAERVVVHVNNPRSLPIGYPEAARIYLHKHDILSPCRKSLWCHEYGYNPTEDRSPVKDTSLFHQRIAEFERIWNYLYKPGDIRLDLTL